MFSKLSWLPSRRCLRATGNGFANRTQTITSALNGAQLKVVSFVMRKTFTPLRRMLNVNVEGHFAFFVVQSLISLQTVNVLRSGRRKTPLRVQIFNGLWQTRNRVHLVSDKLKKIKVAII